MSLCKVVALMHHGGSWQQNYPLRHDLPLQSGLPVHHHGALHGIPWQHISFPETWASSAPLVCALQIVLLLGHLCFKVGHDQEYWATWLCSMHHAAAEIWQQHGDWIQQHKPQFGPGVKERFEMASSITPEVIPCWHWCICAASAGFP
eukprot:scaffold11812_cov18-Tisochrysis_lutea.AAC.2